MRRPLFLLIVSVSAVALAAVTYRCLTPKLPPLVFLIGDSISEGYAPTVNRALRMAHVERQPERCRYTNCILRTIDIWIANSPRWRVVLFNSGYHDVRLRKDTGLVVTTIEDYASELKAIATKLRGHSDVVIFATTTPIPIANDPAFSERSIAYNAVARTAMKEIGVEVLDLYEIGARLGPEYREEPNDAHFTDPGYEILGQAAAGAIIRHLR